MVQIKLLNQSLVTYRSTTFGIGETIRIRFDDSIPLSQLCSLLDLPNGSRLLTRGKELDLTKSLEQQGCQTKDTLFLLDAIPSDHCAEWARTGRCSDRNCPKAHSHKMQNSPRYVEHRAAQIARESKSTSATSSPEVTPPLSPELSPQSFSPQCVPCKFWAATGTCRFGDSCFYAHTHVHPLSAESPNSPLELQHTEVEATQPNPNAWAAVDASMPWGGASGWEQPWGKQLHMPVQQPYAPVPQTSITFGDYIARTHCGSTYNSINTEYHGAFSGYSPALPTPA